MLGERCAWIEGDGSGRGFVLFLVAEENEVERMGRHSFWSFQILNIWVTFRLQDSDIFHRHELRTILDLQCAGYCGFDNGDKDKM